MTEYFKPERDDRANLKAMLIALDASDTTLKRDVIRGEGRTGDWGIRGSTDRHDNDGNVIYSDGAGYLLYVTTDEPNEREPSSRPWSGAWAHAFPGPSSAASLCFTWCCCKLRSISVP
jgi:hypothetical protein